MQSVYASFMEEFYDTDSLKAKNGKSDLVWLNEIKVCFEAALIKGAPLAKLLRQLSRFVRCHEQWTKKLNSLKQQFALQLAIVFTLPWSLVFFFGTRWTLMLNELLKFSFLAWFFIAGLCFQAIGIFSFCLLFYFAKKNIFEGEWVKLRGFLVRVYCSVESGSNLSQALQRKDDESAWLELTGLGRKVQRWSDQIREVLRHFLNSGAPSSEVILDLIEGLELEREDDWITLQGKLPTYLSLILCLFFVPAFFLILMGLTWTQI